MVQVTQTDEEIKIVIELNRLITRKPDIVLLPTYIKFNNPPIFFERHLAQEIDELASFCRIFKNEARIMLIKKQRGEWPELFLKLSKEELFKKRLEISNQIVERNKERDQQAMERYEAKRRAEISKEVQRETAMRERVKQFQEKACSEAMMVGIRKETHEKQKVENRPPVTANTKNAITSRGGEGSVVPTRLGTPVAHTMAALRSSGKINVSFSSFEFRTPKRESQEGVPKPFKIEDPEKLKEANIKLDTLDE
ncbi:dynein assembly factor 4, axonemal [Teleopsis dalmanni]|uniref:dynein assembly factor 4, axonemal n=1 Tax=Teleopsis dalmanni TaxID=139649 RepID=UPI0018CD191B|nr:dynein assembly factor 4, axonemal [Teleopsis dalmanni]